MKCNLVCQRFKVLMRTTKRIVIAFNAFIVLFAIFVISLGIIGTRESSINVFSIMLLMFAPLMIPYCIYDKVCQSSVEITPDSIHALDRKGHCWRTISFESVTDIQTKEISGYFYGENRYEVKEKYICFFLNGSTCIPDVSYNKLFRHKDFFLISYQEEIVDYLKRQGKISDSDTGDTGDGSVC